MKKHFPKILPFLLLVLSCKNEMKTSNSLSKVVVQYADNNDSILASNTILLSNDYLNSLIFSSSSGYTVNGNNLVFKFRYSNEEFVSEIKNNYFYKYHYSTPAYQDTTYTTQNNDLSIDSLNLLKKRYLFDDYYNINKLFGKFIYNADGDIVKLST